MNLKSKYYATAFKKNDQKVIAKLYTKNYEPFLLFAKRYPLHTDEVRDIYQDAFVALRDNALKGKIDNLESSIKTYLFAIGKFLIYKKLKKAGKLVEANSNSLQSESLVTEEFELTTSLDQNQQKLQKGFLKLGDKCKEVLTLFYYRGLTIEEIVQIGRYKNSNVVKSQKSRCLKHLKSLITETHGQK